ncbi:CARDB domain-containing protein [Paraflavitalea soli]|nr:CARDB domain-containing protein [Paraflavitalea soli]
MNTTLKAVAFFLFLLYLHGGPAAAQTSQRNAAFDAAYKVLKPQLIEKIKSKQQAISPNSSFKGNANLGQSLAASACFIPVDASYTALPRSNDGSTALINLPFTFNLYGTSYNQVYINTNGTISFLDPEESGFSAGLPGFVPLIAPFWADVDTRNPASGQVYYKITPTHLIVTWDGVGYDNRAADKLNTFQVVMGVPGDEILGPDHNLQLNYGDMQWASSYGFGQWGSTVGVDGGDILHYMQIGRFSENTSDYDGPGGNNDGINWLDNKCFAFDVSTLTNMPPRFDFGSPVRVINVRVGETVVTEAEFAAPEAGQMVSTIMEPSTICNLSFSATTGNVSKVKITITGAACNLGGAVFYVVAADNGNPQQSTTVPFVVIVTADAPELSFPVPEDEDGDGRYPLQATSSGGERIYYEVIGGLAYIEDDTVLVADGVGLVKVRAYAEGDGTMPDVFKDVELCLPAKQPAAITGDAKGCLAYKSTYEVPYVAGASYTWSVDAGARIEFQGTLATVTWLTPGTHTVSVSYKGNCGGEGPVRTLTVEVIDKPLTGAITKMLPADGNMNVSFPLTFSWFPVEQAIGYDIYVWPENGVRPDNPLIQDVTDISYTLYYNGELEYGKHYQWQIVAKGECGILNSPVQLFGLRVLPDLTVRNIQVPPGGFSGQPLTVKWEVKNIGSGATADRQWLDKVYLSLDQVLDDRDLEVAYAQNTSELGAGSSYSNTATFTLPNGINNKYYIFIEANAFHAFPESNETNNTGISASTTNIQLTPPPDLQVTQVTPPNNAFSGQPVEILWTVKNAGTGKVTGKVWWDNIYLSKEPVLNLVDAIRLGIYREANDLNDGASYTKTATVKIPDTVFGNYYVFVVTDESDRVYEHAAENNNTGRSEVVNIILTPPVDLVVPKVEIPATAVSGEKVSISWRVENGGGSTTGGNYWRDDVFLSPTKTFNDKTAIALGTATSRMALAPGEGYNTFIEFVLPAKITGDYYVIVQADATKRIYEYTSDDNNTGSSVQPLHITAADLVVGAITAPATGTSGNTMALAWTLKNNGNGALKNTKITDRILLSASATWNEANSKVLKEVVYQTGVVAAGDDTLQHATVLLPDGMAGNYYIYVQTDYKDTVYETGGDNNIRRSTAPVAITLGPWADLQVSQVKAKDTAAAADATIISYTVINKGNKATNDSTWKDKVYISLKPVWDAAASIFIRDIPQKRNIGKDGTYQVETPIRLPGNIGGADYYVYVFTNAEKTVYEHSDTTNNTGRSNKLYVHKYPPVDLVVTSVTAPATGKSGNAIAVKWSVKNEGEAITLENEWSDALYLSADTVFDKDDQLVKAFTHRGNLPAGTGYIDEQNFVLPNGVSGNYYLLLVTDGQHVNYDADTTNNYGMVRKAGGGNNDPVPIGIELTPPADLVVSSFTTPEEGFAGQPIKVKWKVKNSGAGITAAGNWTERVYLSKDVLWDKDDRVIGTYNRAGVLAAGGEYHDSLEVFLPQNDLGNHVLIFRSDVNNNVYEHGAEENISTALITIIKDELSDLVVTDIEVPEMAMAGGEVMVQWTLQNKGTNPSRGYLQEGIYLSTDTSKDAQDILVASIPSKINLAPNATLARSQKISLKGASLRDYHVLIHADILNNIVEINDNNNITPSGQVMKVTVDELPLHVQKQQSLPDNKEVYYRIEIPDSLAGESLLVTLQGDTAHANNELFLRRGEMPTRAVHDYAFGEPFKANQEITVPALEAGTYYLLVYGKTTPNTVQPIGLLAEILHFEVRLVDAAEGGNTGQVTVQVKGSKLGTVKSVRLRNNGASIEADRITVSNPVSLFAQFDLEGAAAGVYDVVAENEAGDTAVLAGGFRIVAGSGAGLETNVVTPPNTRPSNVLSIQVQFANTGNTDIINPVLTLTSLGGAPIALQPAELAQANKALKLALQEVNGPIGRLRPGAKGTIIVYAKATTVLGFMLEEEKL